MSNIFVYIITCVIKYRFRIIKEIARKFISNDTKCNWICCISYYSIYLPYKYCIIVYIVPCTIIICLKVDVTQAIFVSIQSGLILKCFYVYICNILFNTIYLCFFKSI